MSDHGSLLKDRLHKFLNTDNLYRVNILGSAPGWEDAPDDNGYLWAVNNVHLLRDVDLVVDIHSNRINPEIQKDKHHMNMLSFKQVPTYAIREIEGAPNIKKYPIEEIVEEFNTDYFGCGIDYIIALAIFLGAKEIHLYGIWLAMDTEYARQKPTVEHWLGIAKGRGVDVFVHGEKSHILKTPNGLMYGYQTPQQWVKDQNPEQYELLVSDLNKLAEKYRKDAILEEQRQLAADEEILKEQGRIHESTDSIESS